MTKVEKVRVGLLSVLGIIVVSIVGYSTLYVFNLVPGWGTSTEKTFVTLDRPLANDPIEIVEFFSYGCPFCARLEPTLESWIEDLPQEVEFRRVHVAVDTMTNRLAKTYLVLESQGALVPNHRRVFDAIHERNMTFTNEAQLAEFMHGRGIESDRFLSAYNGARISRLMEMNRQLAIETRTAGVPSLLIGNKFQVNSQGGNRQMLDTAEWLVAELLAGRDPSPPTEAAVEVDEENLEAPVTDSEETNVAEEADS